MRLTLRTMLAYMDDILEPEDAQRIGQKIEESEYANGLLHRIRDVTRRLRLAAPEVTDRSTGLDPNTVAEYLDNTLSDDRVPDFEKVCLGSNIHLAEVASCHQILTLVLGQPAEVRAAGRQRMYRLPRLLGEEPDDETVPPDEPTGTAVDAGPEQPTHPLCLDTSKTSYDRKPARKPKRRLTVAAVLLLAVLISAALLAALGQFEPGTPIGDFLRIDSQKGGQQLAQGSNPAGESGSSTGKHADHANSSTRSTRRGGDSPADETEPSKVVQPTSEPGSDKPPSTDIQADPADTRLAGTEIPSAPLPLRKPSNPTAEGPIQPEAAPAAESGKAPAKLAMLPGIRQPAEAPPRAPSESNAEPAPLPQGRLGQFISEESDHEVLLRFDPDSATWRHVPAKGSLPPRHELLALPTFRPLIELVSGLRLRLIGGTQVQLEPADRQGVAGLTIGYGRLLLQNTGEAKTRLRLRAGDRTGLIIFDDARSAVAIEVTRHLVPGTDPQTQPASMTVSLFAASGRNV